MIRDEPLIRENYVAKGLVKLLFHPVLDHGRSLELHTIAECVGEQNPLAFWKAHDLLFERQNQAWAGSDALVLSWMSELGVDQEQLQTCVANPQISERLVRMDRQRVNAGIRIRPTFQLNERLIEGALRYEQFAQLIDAQLAQ